MFVFFERTYVESSPRTEISSGRGRLPASPFFFYVSFTTLALSLSALLSHPLSPWGPSPPLRDPPIASVPLQTLWKSARTSVSPPPPLTQAVAPGRVVFSPPSVLRFRDVLLFPPWLRVPPKISPFFWFLVGERNPFISARATEAAGTFL